jgi:hypothetical protein
VRFFDRFLDWSIAGSKCQAQLRRRRRETPPGFAGGRAQGALALWRRRTQRLTIIVEQSSFPWCAPASDELRAVPA